MRYVLITLLVALFPLVFPDRYCWSIVATIAFLWLFKTRGATAVILAFFALILVPLMMLMSDYVCLQLGVPKIAGWAVCWVFTYGVVDTLYHLDDLIRMNKATVEEQKEFLRRAG